MRMRSSVRAVPPAAGTGRPADGEAVCSLLEQGVTVILHQRAEAGAVAAPPAPPSLCRAFRAAPRRPDRSMSDVLTIPPSGASRTDIRRIVEVLQGGGLAALPDETGYVLCASPLAGEALERLLAICPADQTGLSCLDGEAAEDLAPPEAWTPAAARLARRCWPGPLVLEFPANPSASV